VVAALGSEAREVPWTRGLAAAEPRAGPETERASPAGDRRGARQMSSGQRDTNIIPDLTDISTRAPANRVPLRHRVILFAVAVCACCGIWYRPLSRTLDRIAEHRERRP